MRQKYLISGEPSGIRTPETLFLVLGREGLRSAARFATARRLPECLRQQAIIWLKPNDGVGEAVF